ncbi:MAG: tRNA dihydrouridine synthase DusB [Bacteroidetes bacterium]|nr:tRNA dihydrouridine synthase DusB [Bacteroidota bacterium]
MVKIGTLNLGEFPVILAPMEDITDPPFRRLCKRMGADLMFTEFISSDGLIRDAIKSTRKLDFIESERPLGIQIFGSEVDAMREAALVAEKANPDLIDLNFGCPVRKVAGKGGGAGLLKDIPRMTAITEAVVKSTHLPVTVKTRLGWDDSSKDIVEIAERLQDIGIQAITIHGRTRAQMYKGEADWTLIGEVKNNPRMHIPVIGNGDIDSPQKALEQKNRYGVDGIMIGRAVVGNPTIFRSVKHFLQTGELLPESSISERVAFCREHLTSSIEWKGAHAGVVEMRKHYAGYFKGIKDFKPYRMKLLTTLDYNEIFEILNTIKSIYQ